MLKMKKIGFMLLVAFASFLFMPSPVSVKAVSDGEWEYEVSDGIAIITRYKGNDTKVIIPEYVEEIRYYQSYYYPVGGIRSNSFSQCKTLKSVNIPDSIGNYSYSLPLLAIDGNSSSITAQLVGYVSDRDRFLEDAFNNCPSLTEIIVGSNNKRYSSVDGVLFDKNKKKLIRFPEGKAGKYVIPQSVTSIGNSAFSSCKNLKGVTIKNSVTSIASSAFYKCINIEKITIPNKVTQVGSSAFNGCTKLKQVIVSDSIALIGSYTFNGCKKLSKVSIPNKVVTIGSYAFNGCGKLSKVNIPNQTTIIGDAAFKGCAKLSKINIPSKVIEIGSEAFKGCTSLKCLFIPYKIRKISNICFEGCTSLEVILVDNRNPYYSSVNGVLFDMEKTKLFYYPEGKKDSTYTIPKSVVSIQNKAFSGCKSLKSMTIPKSVTYIGSFAKYGKKIKIYCKKGSVAHIYAVKNNLNFSFKMNNGAKTNASIVPTKSSVKKGKVMTLSIKGNKSIKKVSWKSFDKSVISIIKGAKMFKCIIKGIKKGDMTFIGSEITFKNGIKKMVAKKITVK